MKQILPITLVHAKVLHSEVLKETPEPLIVNSRRVNLLEDRYKCVPHTLGLLICYPVKAVPEVFGRCTIESHFLEASQRS